MAKERLGNMIDEASTDAKVLVVEDNPGDARLTRELLIDAGWPNDAIAEAGTLADACQTLARQGADVVLLDLSLPDASDLKGLTALQQAQPTIPIVVLSGHDDEMHALAAVQQGAQDYLVKTDITVDTVRRAVRYAIERKRLTHSLLEAKVNAELASRAKSEFLANMSHELRTPLNAIIGFAEVLEGQSKGELGHPSYVDYVRDIHESGRHLLAVINSILDVAKVEAGHMELTEEPVELSSVIASVVRLLRNEAAQAEVELACDLQDSLPAVYADRRLLRQIFSNLLSNAIKFSRVGGKVVVTAEVLSSGEIVGRVEDNGIGIAPEQLEHITQPFVQVQSTFTRSYQGTGLGLSIVKSFAELHGGRLDIASVHGKGTTVSVTLPADRLLHDEGDTASRQAAGG